MKDNADAGVAPLLASETSEIRSMAAEDVAWHKARCLYCDAPATVRLISVGANEDYGTYCDDDKDMAAEAHQPGPNVRQVDLQQAREHLWIRLRVLRDCAIAELRRLGVALDELAHLEHGRETSSSESHVLQARLQDLESHLERIRDHLGVDSNPS